MKTRSLLSLLLVCVVVCTLSSCSAVNKLFARKQGCPSNGKNVGAERLLTGEKKLPKAKKFRA
jgi:uncharacterized protein YceK